MIKPPALKIGDTIGIMAPSSRVEQNDIDSCTAFLHSHGFRTFVHPQTFEHLHQSAGTNEQKRNALHDLAKNPDIAAVFFATGGNRALHLLDIIDFDLIRAHPKIYMGFSDNTALLNAITARTGIITYHGPTAKRLPTTPQAEFNLRLLKGEENVIPLTGATSLHKGSAEGFLIGGNISLFQYLIHSGDMPDANGAILFLEDCYEEWSRIDRDFCFFRRSGLLDKINGLILGQFTNMLDTGTLFGFTFEDIIAEHTAGLDIPIITNAPFGHDAALNYIMPIGQKVRLNGFGLELI
jgi:muramoyltetrapeptide carboxypeptidase